MVKTSPFEGGFLGSNPGGSTKNIIMNEAFVFQHIYSGIQLFIYHAKNMVDAREKFMSIVSNEKDWGFLGKKFADTAK